MLKFKKFEMQDLEFFTPREQFKSLYTDMEKATTQSHFTIWTIYSGKKVVSILGFRRMGPGIAELFSLVSNDVHIYKLEYVKKVRIMLRAFPKTFGLHKLIFTVNEEDKWAYKWAKLLGFDEEGYLKKYDILGNNHILFGRAV